MVPSRWLVRHVMWAERGADLVVGTAEPVGVARGEALAAWHARHQLVEGHTHVHGANLGVRADRWRQVGGFGQRTVGEDVDLVERVRALTGRWVATDTTRVLTSGGRAAGSRSASPTTCATSTPRPAEPADVFDRPTRGSRFLPGLVKKGVADRNSGTGVDGA